MTAGWTRRERVIAGVRWLILALVTALAAVSLWRYWGPVAPVGGTATADRYWCAMHHQVRSPVPGVCPICHMDLVPIPGLMATGAGTVMGDGAGGDGGMEAPAGMAAVTLTLDRVQAIGVVTEAAQAGTPDEALRAPASVEAREGAQAEVHVRSPGFVERIAVRETGVRVARGEILAWVYSPAVYQAQQEFLTAQRWATAPAGGDTVALARAGRAGLELLGMTAVEIDGIARTGTALRDVPLRAPVGGWVTHKAVVLGTYATPEMVLYGLSDLGRVWAVAGVYARDLTRVRRGTEARFVTPEGDDLPARVEAVEPMVSADTRTARVRLELANPGMRLRPGQWGEAVFPSLAGERAAGVTVPRDAVVDTGTAQYVFVDRGAGRFEPRRVRVGAEEGERTRVLEGLRPGERVVTRGGFLLDAESRLRAALTTDAVGGASR